MTRTYYVPKNRIGLHIINHIIDRIGCSIGELKVSQITSTIRVPITCNDKDIPKVEKILRHYGAMD